MNGERKRGQAIQCNNTPPQKEGHSDTCTAETDLTGVALSETSQSEGQIQSYSQEAPAEPDSEIIYGCESWTIKKAEHRRMILLNCGVGEDS